MKVTTLVGLLLTFSSVFASDNIQCRDENNNPVDWFFVYKFPHLIYAKQSSVTEGKGYMFITDQGLNDGWLFSKKNIDSNDTLFANTLAFLRTGDKNAFLWLVYNDEGDIECETCGHTKGFVGGDTSGGFWLIHSVPRYLTDEYPTTGLRYGQSALCISLNQTVLNSIGDLLRYNQPNFQKWNLNDNLTVFYPKIKAAINNLSVKAPYSFQMSIISKGGSEFQGFAKSREFNKDLYEWVANSLREDLYTETWINDRGVLPSSCDTEYSNEAVNKGVTESEPPRKIWNSLRVINVLNITCQNLDINYSSHKDHSKLAIAVSRSKPWVCVGDINRAKSQEHRGGGTVCLQNVELWKLYFSMINSTEDCLYYINDSFKFSKPIVENEILVKLIM